MRAKKGKRWGISSMALSSLNYYEASVLHVDFNLVRPKDILEFLVTNNLISLAVLRNDLEESFSGKDFEIIHTNLEFGGHDYRRNR